MTRVLNLNVIKNFLIILLPLVIILGNFRYLVFNFNFYNSLYEKSGVYQTFDKDLAKYETDNLFDYFRGQNNIDHNFFSNQAITHLADVKDLIRFSTVLLYLALIAISALVTALAVKGKYKSIAQALFTSALITLVFILLLALGILKTFESLFTGFHQVLFTNNLWQFSQDDNLIKLFPQEFFIEFASRLSLNIIISSAIIVLVSHIARRKILKWFLQVCSLAP